MNAAKAEKILRSMRERALTIEDLPAGVEAHKSAPVDLEPIKKLYFHAGRWAGGARDWTARKAFEKMNQVERV